jgi:hypothetical protein
MEKLNLVSFLTFLVLISACNVFNSSDQGQSFKYQFETDKSTYSSQETINASFINKSAKTLFLTYQICTITDMQTLASEKWKSVPIPIFCTQEVKSPVKVAPGEKLETGVNLKVFDKKELDLGTYRLDVKASYKDKSQWRELVSNNFKITN